MAAPPASSGGRRRGGGGRGRVRCWVIFGEDDQEERERGLGGGAGACTASLNSGKGGPAVWSRRMTETEARPLDIPLNGPDSTARTTRPLRTVGHDFLGHFES